MTYDEAIVKLNEIMKQIETEEALSVDSFKQKSKEAKDLIMFCQNELINLEKQIDDILEK